MALEREPVRAPPLQGAAWLNVAAPLTWADLRGKLVLLDFWTYCCINCIHVLDELRAIEARFAGEPLVVIGVHSAKFENEQEIDHIRAAIGRYDIHHPVLVDDHHALWNAFAVKGWPTLVLVDPQGYLLGSVAGEGHGPQLEAAIGEALDLLRAKGALNDTPLPVHLEVTTEPTTALRYPGKVLADPEGPVPPAHDRLFIADSGYHRIEVTTLTGKHLMTIGSGHMGHADGDFETATFHNPQGLALDGERLYVADTGNHLIRRVDLTAGTVTTLAGTGSQARQRATAGPAMTMPLNSPWDLALDGPTLWIAMAGPHQIWALDLATGMLRVAAGSGSEGRLDGQGPRAAFAQPNGLALDAAGRRLFVADSEISCLRALDLAADPLQVQTVAGGDLFDFGLRDGPGDSARFQHPLGVTWDGTHLYVADTYNHAIRRVDPTTGTVRTVAGFAEAGMADGRGRDARFYEPGGLSVVGNQIFVADTNNHAIRVLDRATGATHTLDLSGVCAPGFCLPPET